MSASTKVAADVKSESERAAINEANAKFWDELCGSGFARALGITDRSQSSLKRFDDAYLAFYPYLLDRVPVTKMRGKSVLEIGLGYGTLSQKIAEAGASYNGLDIAQGPVDMVNERLRMLGLSPCAVQGSMLECPFLNNSMDFVVSIGCFHHTGDTQRCIDETLRVLRPGGHAYIMVYNRFSYRQWRRWPLKTLLSVLGVAKTNDAQRAAYDINAAGQGAPETEFFSKGQLKQMFSKFSAFDAKAENCEDLIWGGKIRAKRQSLLPIIGPVCGLDVYIDAVK